MDTVASVLDALPESAPPSGAADAVARARASRENGGPRSRRNNAGGRRGGRKKTKAELARELREANERLASYEPGDDATPDTLDAGDADAAELAASLAGPLAQSLKTVSGIMARVLAAPWWQFNDTEAATLASGWAPVLAPQLARHADKLPVVMAVGVTVEVLLPRVEKQIAAQKARAAGVQTITDAAALAATEDASAPEGADA